VELKLLKEEYYEVEEAEEKTYEAVG